MLIGDYLKQQRKIQGKTLEDLSRDSGLSKSHISRIEHNESNNWEPLTRLMGCLGLSMETLKTAGIEWWAIDNTRPAARPDQNAVNDDLAFIIEWAKAQDDVTLKALRTFINSLGG